MAKRKSAKVKNQKRQIKFQSNQAAQNSLTIGFKNENISRMLFYLLILFLAWNFVIISRDLIEGVALPKELSFGLTAAIVPLFMVIAKRELKFSRIDVAFVVMLLLFIPSYFGALDKRWFLFHFLNLVAFFLLYISSANLFDKNLTRFSNILMLLFMILFAQASFQLLSEWKIIALKPSGIFSYIFVDFHKGAAANFNQPNLFAVALASFLPFFYYRSIKSPPGFIFLFADFFLLELTHSRGGFLDAAFCMAFLLIFIRVDKRHLIKTVLFVVLGILLADLTEHFASGFTLFDKWHRAFTGGASVRLRILIWLDAINLFLQHPIFGIGLGNFKSFSILSQSDLLMHHGWIRKEFLSAVPPLSHAWAHSEYLHILCETGLVGFSGFMLLIYTIIKRAINFIKIKNREALILFASLIPYFVHSFFSFPLHFPPTFLLLAVLLGMFASYIDNGEKIFTGKLPYRLSIAVLALTIGYITLTSYQNEKIVASFDNRSFWERSRSAQAAKELKSALSSPFVARDAKKTLSKIYYFAGIQRHSKKLIGMSLRYLKYRYKIHPHVNTAYLISREEAMLGKLKQSYKWYKQAFLLYPRKDFYRRFPAPFRIRRKGRSKQ